LIGFLVLLPILPFSVTRAEALPQGFRDMGPITMMQRRRISFYIVVFALLLFCEVQALYGQTNIKEAFFGSWRGEGEIIVAWCEQKQLSFELQIDANGIVSGKVGNAQIRSGRLRRNNFLFRWLGNAEFIIDAKLSNHIIEKENIQRESIRIFLDYRKPFFTGGFHTSGSKFGGNEKMMLSGIGIRLAEVGT
jgi:hypothetical protein